MRIRAPEVWLGDSAASMRAVAELAELVGPLGLREIGELLGVTRERIRQIQVRALGRALCACRRRGVEAPAGNGPVSAWDELELRAWGDAA